MAIKARVELTKSFTYARLGRNFERGKPQILTDPEEIRCYMQMSGFAVTLLDDANRSKAVAPATGPEERPEVVEPEADMEPEPKVTRKPPKKMKKDKAKKK